jgi:diaminohydroxyphosphoribosylaminopyrimidine deaminase / 5-amino-6-(5-phosphoribosylamino)uracil reductase
MNRRSPGRTRPQDQEFMRLALRLARKASGCTSPNPMVGAVLVRGGRIIGRGWHRRAGQPHAEIEALCDAAAHGCCTRGATLYVTLEPCCTFGRTPPCTAALKAAGLSRVVVAATDPNPAHAGRAFRILRRAGIEVTRGVLAGQAEALNEAFNHWIVHRTPLVTVKAAMTLDGKIATATGESKWITGERARAWSMKLRRGADAIMVGVNTILADDPHLTIRSSRLRPQRRQPAGKRLLRIVLDSHARTPLSASVVSDDDLASTLVVVTAAAPAKRIAALARRVRVIRAPAHRSRIALRWLLKKLGSQNVTSLLVEGGGEVNASFLAQNLAQRVALFYAPKILGGTDAIRGVAGTGARGWPEVIRLRAVRWRRLGPDLLLTAGTEPIADGRRSGLPGTA